MEELGIEKELYNQKVIDGYKRDFAGKSVGGSTIVSLQVMAQELGDKLKKVLEVDCGGSAEMEVG
jgi:hypothetical protein